MENFQEMRMQALIALVVSFPRLVCGLLVRGFFEGDYSLGQRAGMVSAIGMGARELAGMEDTDLPLSEASGKGKAAADMFPSKKLLGKMHDTWAGAGRRQAGPLDRITGSMEKLMISPMAAEAADKVTGPNVLKVRTFSSRIEVEKRRKKPVESKLGKVVGEAFFFPLTGRWWGALKDLWVAPVLVVWGGSLILVSVVEAKAFTLNLSCLRSLSRLWLLFFTPLVRLLLRFLK